MVVVVEVVVVVVDVVVVVVVVVVVLVLILVLVIVLVSVLVLVLVLVDVVITRSGQGHEATRRSTNAKYLRALRARAPQDNNKGDWRESRSREPIIQTCRPSGHGYASVQAPRSRWFGMDKAILIIIITISEYTNYNVS